MLHDDMRAHPRAAVIGLALAGVIAVSWTAFADQTPVGADPEEQARTLFRELMSPYCEGLLLSDCPSSQAAALRDTIRAQLRRGQTPDQVVDNMVSIYGRWILSAPPAEGVGAIVWFAPIVALIVGLGLVAVWLNRRTAQTAPDKRAPPPAAAADTHERVRRELDQYDH